ncbi:hypothetical protein N3K66_000688 [Trichothecium roseum]|uniref:Uncharacterized protein n=1 Tax=Trichothecium roseum TaxID=47278 RepID=A0ACC0VCY5_9HYPO|nr:hypothetical protein N3K66_000688 [Trichothecium roseum]
MSASPNAFGPGQPNDQQSINLSLNFGSNNPFRNRAASPASPASPFDDPPARPLSRNPFIDNPIPAQPRGSMSNGSEHKSLSAEEIFASLTLDEKAVGSGTSGSSQQPPSRRPAPGQSGPAPRRGENVPPPQDSANRHRPTKSQEEALRAKRMQGPGADNQRRPPQQSTSPSRRPPPSRRPRRNSDSSVMDFDAKPLTDEEKRMIQAKRERDRRRKEGNGREGRSSSYSKEAGREGREGREEKSRSSKSRPSRRMDIIDQLDATSIYGTGLYHHDGPFDALNPHRNRSSRKNAPMQAFPKDSLNNSLGGAGPLNSQADHSALMGTNNEEAFRDFAGSARNKDGSSKGPDAPIFNPIQGVDMVHGDESVGLGTSTFLEGTPAARTAIHRHREEQAREVMEGGLQRKKSLAQRIRRVGGGQREPRDPNFSYRSPETVSAGTESNPFFSEYGRGEDVISVPNRDGALSPTSPPPVPRRDSNGAPLERRATTDATTTLGEDGGKPTGFIGRMKSLKGGRRPKGSNEVTTPPPNPGSAM